jgi:RNA polymerase sigma-70 factor (ECF subfamily)
MNHDGLTLVPRTMAPGETALEETSSRRLRAIVDAHYDFVWRSLRRLGVHDADVDDAAQQVFVTVSRKLAAIRCGCERSFLFQTALRVSADSRRTRRRRREVAEDQLSERDEAPDPTPPADSLVDLRRAREQLDEILDGMPLDLRAVFVLFELDGATLSEMSALLQAPVGTVASRLRRARLHFRSAAARLAEAKAPPGGER